MQYYVPTAAEAEANEDMVEGVKRAQAILERLDNRQLYKFAGEVAVPPEQASDPNWRAPSAAEVLACVNAQGGLKMTADQLYVEGQKIDYCKKNDNPLRDVTFYLDRHTTGTCELSPEQMCAMGPRNFMERTIRVFVKSGGPKAVDAAKLGLHKWAERKGYPEQPTPLRNPTLTGQEHRRRRESGSGPRGGSLFAGVAALAASESAPF